ncbi:MAG: S-layer homology domain-containing protein [Candidatus Electrothrix sp. LOE1_4_5]|nr:S-layer homology domain-containing protein [Candidatus Electrothrix gigas]
MMKHSFFRRINLLLSCIFFIFISFLPAIAQNSTSTSVTQCIPNFFTDVDESHPYCDDIIFAVQSKWVKGYGDNTFRPENYINRAEMTKIVLNMVYKEQDYGENCFYQVSSEDYEIKIDDWHSKFVCPAKRLGIVKGTEDGHFYPYMNVTKAEALKIILRTLGFKGIEPEDAPWYTPYIAEAATMGIFVGNGYIIDHAEANSYLTRAEMTHYIHTIYEKYYARSQENSNFWIPVCTAHDANVLPFYNHPDLNNPTCKDRWTLYLYMKISNKPLHAEAHNIKDAIEGIEEIHDTVDDVIRAISAADSLYGIISNRELRSIWDAQMFFAKEVVQYGFDESEDSPAAAAIGGIFSTLFDIYTETIGYAINPGPITFMSLYKQGLVDLSYMTNDLIGVYKLGELTEKISNFNIASSYLYDFYKYGGDNGLVAENICNISRTANIYDTLYHYALKKGYENTFWGDVYNLDRVVDIVERTKEDVRFHVNRCFDLGKCVGQKQQQNIPESSIPILPLSH